MSAMYIGPVSPEVLAKVERFKYYYLEQKGGTITFSYLPGYEQDGAGIGNIIWSFLKPLLVSAGKAAGTTALNATSGYVGDLIAGQNWRTAGKERLNEMGTELVEKAKKRMYGQGVKHKRGRAQMLAAVMNKRSRRVPRGSIPGASKRKGRKKKKKKKSARHHHKQHGHGLTMDWL